MSSAACDYCGSLGWTVERYGRVTHKEGCPHRTDPWHQGDPQMAEVVRLLLAVQMEEINGRLCPRPESHKDKCCAPCRDLWRHIDEALVGVRP